MFGKVKKFAINYLMKSWAAPLLYGMFQYGPEWTDWDGKKAIDEGYKSSSWVFACVNQRMNAVSSVKIRGQIKKGDNWEYLDSDHPLQKLLDKPNPNMNQSDFLRYCVSHLDLDGNFFALKVRAGMGNKTAELWPVKPYEVSPWAVEKSENYIDFYKFEPTGDDIPYQDMFHVMYTNPDSFRRGTCPLKAAAKSVDIDNAAGDFQKISFQQRGIPDGVFQVEGAVNQTVYDQAKKKVKEQYANLGTAREPWVLGNGTWTPLSRTAVEMDFMGTRQFAMREICAVYGVPSEMISGMGDANRASSETVRKTFWEDTIIPLVNGLVSNFNLDLAYEYGKDIRIVADYSNVKALQKNESETIKNAKELWGMGVPFEQLNRKYELGFDKFDGWEKSFLSSGVIPSDKINELYQPQQNQGTTSKEQNKKEDLNTIEKLYNIAYGEK